MKSFLVFLASISVYCLFGQSYWQQKANYKMDIKFDDGKHQFSGIQYITYTNNSPDELTHLFYHLYFNAFQPGSEMDLRSLSIKDPDPRVGARISELKENETGWTKVKSLTLNGEKLDYKTEGTILEIKLKKGIKSNSTVELKMEFESQVPIQIRRSGRNNKEGIDYSMAQWYPKLCEYDAQGWHANPYLGREFYGIWGNFDVTIEMDKKFVVAASGVIQNADEVGHGYSEKRLTINSKKIKWHFIAENVHDFVWAADPDYKHISKVAHDGTILRFFYQENDKTKDTWTRLPTVVDEALRWINEKYGKYPYPVYSVIQGGDGGMEYPMATLITGERPFASLVGVTLHELMHSWYQMVLGTNEALYAWMDEGFTSYSETETTNYLRSKGILPGESKENPHVGSVNGYINFAASGNAEPLSIHADHYKLNTAYSVNAYTKGQLCLLQLQYILGKPTFDKALNTYFNEWKFKHPTPNDFFRVMEKEAGLELDWFKEYWVNSTDLPDYKIDTIIDQNLKLSRVGAMPMPLDIVVTTKSGKKELYYIPIVLMRGEKKPDIAHDEYIQLADWPWANTQYSIDLKCKLEDIKSIEIDPSIRLVDTNRSNNVYPPINLEDNGQ